MPTFNEIRSSRKAFERRIKGIRGITGLCVGYRRVNGRRVEQLAYVVNVSRKLPLSSLASDQIIPQQYAGVRVDVQALRVKALDDGKRYRPIRPGCSIGHERITAGTLGAIVMKGGERYALSNNHVLANSNNASIGDWILQPGPYDGGVVADRCGTLAEFVPISFAGMPSDCNIGKGVAGFANLFARLAARKTRLKAVAADDLTNLVDCALAGNLVESDARVIDIDLAPSSDLVECLLAKHVQKRGRTTGVTHGEVTGVDATIQVSYGDAGTAIFEDQVIVEDGGGTKDFSAGGDSGSLVMDLEDMRPCGLLFAGGEDESTGHKVTVINRIQNVVDALNIRF